MESHRRSFCAALTICIALLTSCKHSVYLKATETFADSTKAGIDTFRPAATTAHTICISRAESAFLRQRLSGEKPWGSRPKRSEWFDDASVGPVTGTTWNSYCEEIKKTNEGLQRIYGGLGAYADALKNMEEGAKVDADKLSAVAQDTSSLVGKLTPANSPVGTAGAIMTSAFKAAAGPLADLARLVEESIADKKLRDSVKKTDPAIQGLLGHLLTYSSAVKSEALALQNDTQVLLNQMDTSLKDAHPDALRGAEFASYAHKAEQDARDQITAQDKYQLAVNSLKAAHDALAKAAQQKLSDESLASAIAARRESVVDAVRDIQALLHIKGSAQ